MRFHGRKNTPAHPVAPDTIISLKLTAASVQAFDFPQADLVRFSFGSSDATNVAFVNIGSTKANVPTTAFTISSEGSTAFNIPVVGGCERIYQIPGATTGFSVISPSSGYFCAEFWNWSGSSST